MSSPTGAHDNSKVNSQQHASQPSAPEAAGIEPAVASARLARQLTGRDPESLSYTDVLQLQRVIGNQAVTRLLTRINGYREDGTALIQRDVVELPGVAITGNPRFYSRAERRNRYWASNPPTPNWPYDDRLRQIWDQGNVDEFADAVRQHQEEVMGVPPDEADGILGPRTSASLEAHSTGSHPGEAETQQPTEGAASPPVEETQPPISGEASQPGEAEAQPPTEGATSPPAETGSQQPEAGEPSPPGEAETQQSTEGEAPQPGEAEAQPPTEGQTAGSGSALPAGSGAEIRQVPQWIMEYARGTPWPVHSVLYQQAMASGGLGIEELASTWEGFLGQMGEMDFLRHPIVGHQTFLRRLDMAQRWLEANHPRIARLAYNIGTPGTRTQWRAAERLTRSPHLFGMAVDINGGQNPWMSNRGEVERNTRYAWIIWRATWLMGRGSPVTPSDSHRRAGSHSSHPDRRRSSQHSSEESQMQSTQEIHEHFRESNQATLEYLNLDGNREQVTAKLRSIGEPPPAIEGEANIGGYVPSSIPIERLRQGLEAIDDWMQVIQYDRQHWPNQPRGGGPVSGIMNLPLELVVALRDVAHLQWGACDLGERESGDMMHFALDPPRFFAFRGRVNTALEQAERGMTQQAVREAQQVEEARREQMAARGNAEARGRAEAGMARSARQEARRARTESGRQRRPATRRRTP